MKQRFAGFFSKTPSFSQNDVSKWYKDGDNDDTKKEAATAKQTQTSEQHLKKRHFSDEFSNIFKHLRRPTPPTLQSPDLPVCADTTVDRLDRSKMFAKLLSTNAFFDINQAFYDYITKAMKCASTDIKAISQNYHEFYDKIFSQLMLIAQFRQAIVEDAMVANACVERVVFNKLCNIWVNHIKKTRNDLTFSLKLHNLCWVTEEHLQVPRKIMSTPPMVIRFCAAQTALRDMTTRRTPSGKLRSLSRCCQALFSLIQDFELGRPPNADDFLPVLVYAIIKTNPSDLHSTIDFINEFGQRAQIEAGECAYYLTSLTCAVAFLDNCDGASFNISQDDFQELLRVFI